jgi:hypothetical protein
LEAKNHENDFSLFLFITNNFKIFINEKNHKQLFDKTNCFIEKNYDNQE